MRIGNHGLKLAVVLGMVLTAQAESVTISGKVAITGSPYKVETLILKTSSKGDLPVELNLTGLEMAFYDGKEVEAKGELEGNKLTVKSYRSISAKPAAVVESTPTTKSNQVPGLAPDISTQKKAPAGKSTAVNKPKPAVVGKPVAKVAPKPVAKVVPGAKTGTNTTTKASAKAGAPAAKKPVQPKK